MQIAIIAGGRHLFPSLRNVFLCEDDSFIITDFGISMLIILLSSTTKTLSIILPSDSPANRVCGLLETVAQRAQNLEHFILTLPKTVPTNLITDPSSLLESSFPHLE